MIGLDVRVVSKVPKMEGGHIFNSGEFQALKNSEVKNLVLIKNKLPLARISFSLDHGKAISGQGATFGSVDSTTELSKETATYFLKEVCTVLKKHGAKEVVIKHWPEGYTSSNDIQASLAEIGFKVIAHEINQHIAVQDEPFKQLISKSERKKLNQGIKENYSFKILTINDLKSVYALVEETRVRKDFPVSMSFEELNQTIKALPDKYLLFGLFAGEELIAASVSIRISEDILYNFYHADAYAYRSTSPIVLLVQEIYNYCKLYNIKILDLGVSSEEGKVNTGLFKFKENLGCVTSAKKTYSMKYD